MLHMKIPCVACVGMLYNATCERCQCNGSRPAATLILGWLLSRTQALRNRLPLFSNAPCNGLVLDHKSL